MLLSSVLKSSFVGRLIPAVGLFRCSVAYAECRRKNQTLMERPIRHKPIKNKRRVTSINTLRMRKRTQRRAIIRLRNTTKTKRLLMTPIIKPKVLKQTTKLRKKSLISMRKPEKTTLRNLVNSRNQRRL